MRSIRVWLVAGVAAFTMACGGGGGGGTVDAAPQPDGSTMPDGGGTPDAAGPMASGHTGTGNVAGGVKAQSPNFKLVGSMGKGDGTAASPNFKHHGGVVGGTQP